MQEKRNYHSYFQLLLIPACCIILFFPELILPKYLSTYFQGYSPQIISPTNNPFFSNYLHKVYNAYLVFPTGWHIYLQALSPLKADWISVFYFLITTLSCLFLNAKLKTTSKLNSTIFSLLPACLIYLLWGNDWMVWTITASTILLTSSYYLTLTETNNNFCFIAVSLLLTFLTSLTCGSLALFSVVIGFIVAVILKLAHYKDFPIFRDTRDILFACSIFIITFSSILLLPSINFPEYSSAGHLVPDDGLPGNILTAYGNTPSIPVINRIEVKSSLGVLVSLLTILTGLFWFKKRTFLNTTLFVIALCCWLDIIPSESISQISPLASISRIIPIFFLFPLTPLLLAILICLTFIQLDNSKKFAFFLFLLLSTIPAYFFYHKYKIIRPGVLYSDKYDLAIKEFNLAKSNYNNEKQIEVWNKLVSPSYIVLNELGLWVLNLSNEISSSKFSSLLKAHPSITSNDRGKAPLSNLTDRNLGTRWSPGTSGQQGHEWVHLYFNEAVNIQGVELDTGMFKTDFARGIELRYQPDCSNKEQYSESDFINYQSIYKQSDWQGSLHFSPDLYPYFTGQSDSKIYFSTPKSVQCLLIRQIGKHHFYDWSIAEIKFFWER